MSDAAAESLVEGTEGLNIVPVTPTQQATLPTILVIVLPLQLHLGVAVGVA